MKAKFSKRLSAYIVDFILVSIISSLFLIIIGPFKSDNNNNNKDIKEIQGKFLNHEISTEEFIDEYTPIYSEQIKNQMPYYIVMFIISILYYVVYVFKNNGQTLGKKLLDIKIVMKKKEEKVTINNLVLRSLFVNNIIFFMFSMVFILFFNNNTLFITIGMISVFNYIILIVSSFMIIFSKEKRGIHDLVGGTEVVMLDV